MIEYTLQDSELKRCKVKLSARESIELSTELWKYLTDTGSTLKSDWYGWEGNGGRHSATHFCFLCQYQYQKSGSCPVSCGQCSYCPYYIRFGSCDAKSSPYYKWVNANTVKARKSNAAKCVKLLGMLLDKTRR